MSSTQIQHPSPAMRRRITVALAAVGLAGGVVLSGGHTSSARRPTTAAAAATVPAVETVDDIAAPADDLQLAINCCLDRLAEGQSTSAGTYQLPIDVVVLSFPS